MRLKDSSLYLCLSVMLCRISLFIYFLATFGAASPGMDIIVPGADVQYFGDLQQFPSKIAAVGPVAGSASKDGAAGAFHAHSSDSREIASSTPSSSSSSSSSPSSGKNRLGRRILDNHSDPWIQPAKPDFLTTHLTLLTTIDGNLHCIDSRNGDIFWTRHPQAVGAVVSSNITKYTKSRSSSVDVVGSPGGFGDRGHLDGDIKYDSEDWTFIVEPSEVPRLYVYSNTSGLQPIGSLVHLVTNSPQIRPDGKRITGGKKTSLLELEIDSGRIVDTFESESGCAGPDGLKGSDLTIVLGHAEYSLCIADPTSGMQWDISYSEYFPVTENPVIAKNGPVKWIWSNKDGQVALWNEAVGIQWNKEFDSPTTAVFDLFVNTRTGKTALARQKKPPGMDDLSPRAHVGIYEDQLFVLSEQNYPLLGKTVVELARWLYLGIDGAENDGKGDDARSDCQAGSPKYPECMVGPHTIGFAFRPDGFLTVDGETYPGEEEKEQPIPIAEPYEPFASPPPISTRTTVVGWLVIVLGIITAVVYSKGVDPMVKQVDSYLEDHNIQFRVHGLVKAVTHGAIGVSTVVSAASSALGISSRNNRESLPEFNVKSMVTSAHAEMEPMMDRVAIEEKSVEMNEKSEKGARRAPRNKASEQDAADGKIGATSGAGVGAGGNGPAGGGGGRKKKRGAGGKGQKAAAAAAAAAAATATATVDLESADNVSQIEQKDTASSGSLSTSGSTAENGENGSGVSQEDMMSWVSTSMRPPSNTPQLKSIQVTETVLGYGSHGTVVYKGSCDGRSVAVKRLLIDFYDVAFHEVRLLQESDDHPNVVRYFRSEQCDRFLYIALELCSASLDDIMERGHVQPFRDLSATLEPQKILHQIISGIHHLHSLKIVHRDIKPQNILIGEPKQRPKPSKSASSTSSLPTAPTPPPLGSSGMITSVVRANPTLSSPTQDLSPGRVLISDFGLCRKLENDQSSFNNTTAHGGRGGAGGGTIGWRAPECFSGLDQDDELLQTIVNGAVGSAADAADDSSSSSQGAGAGGSPGHANRMTRAIDIFSAGCVFYYVLTNGDHPFGDRYSRERNILLDQPNLDGLNSMGQEGIEAKDLISKMIAHNPADRPDAYAVMHHPFFWSANKRLMFMQDCSDRFEIEDRGVENVDQQQTSPLLVKLEHNAKAILGKDWYKVIDRTLVENLGKYRKYDGNSVRDLLRALRNKKHHYHDLPPHVKRALGELPHGFLNYFTSRFPKLMLHLYYIVADDRGLRNESMFKHYFVD